MRLEGKTAIVTGGGRNIGRAISKLFASEGAKVAIFDMDKERAKGVVEEVVELGGEAVYTVGQVNRGRKRRRSRSHEQDVDVQPLALYLLAHSGSSLSPGAPR